MYVLHSGTTGGTFLTNKDLMKNVCNTFQVFLLSAENDFLSLFKYDGELVLVKKFMRKDTWSANKFHDSWLTYVYFDILLNFKIDLVHIRHFINHSFDLPEVAKRLKIPVIVSLHDFYLICPYYVLLDENNKYCAGKCNDNFESCYNSLASLNNINSKKIIPIWRYNVSKMIKSVDYFITTSDFVKNLFLSIFPELSDISFDVIEHGRDFPIITETLYEFPKKDCPIKILCPANYLNIMKGSDFIKSIKKLDESNRIEFHFLGNCRDGIEEYGISHGTFKRDDFYNKVKEIKPSFIGIFSIWPETFCHTLTEAWSCNIPVLGSNIGVIKNRIIKSNGGWIIDVNNPKKAYEEIISIAENISDYGKILKNIEQMSLTSSKDMAEQYMQIYNFFLNDNYFINFENKKYIPPSDITSNKKIISDSELFDNSFYLNKYSDVNQNNLDPLNHWINWGYKELFRNPNSYFSNSFYSTYYLKDEPPWNALTHYALFGSKNNYKRNVFDNLFKDYDDKIDLIISSLKKHVTIIVISYENTTLKNCLSLILKYTFLSFNIIILTFVEISDELNNYLNDNFDYEIYIIKHNSFLLYLIDDIILEINNDVVLINSSVEVSFNWLIKLIISAYSHDDVGYVSPLSNNIINAHPLQHNSSNSLIFTTDGLNLIAFRSSSDIKVCSKYWDGLCLLIKNSAIGDFSFNKNFVCFDDGRGIINFEVSSWRYLIDDSTYVYYNSYSIPKKYLGYSPSKILVSDKNISSVDYMISKAMADSNYDNLSRRILFIIDKDIIRNHILLDYIREIYNCFYLYFDANQIILYDDSFLEIYQYSDDMSYNNIKKFIFNILVSFKIDLIQFDCLFEYSFIFMKLCNLLNIPFFVNLTSLYNKYSLDSFIDYYYNNFKEKFIDFLSLSEKIFINADFEFKFNHLFNYFKNKLCLIDSNNLNNFNNSIKLKKDFLKVLIMGNVDENSLLFDFLKHVSESNLSLFKFIYFAQREIYESEQLIFQGNFEKDYFLDIVHNENINFILIPCLFNDIFNILEQLSFENIPFLVFDDDLLINIVGCYGKYLKLDSKSKFDLINSLAKIDFNIYDNLVKTIIKNNFSIMSEVSQINQLFINQYEKNSFVTLYVPELMFDYNVNEKTSRFSTFDEFLSYSYLNPIIHFPFSKNEKICLDMMNKLSNYLVNSSKSSYHPLISIIMPVYNRENVVMNAINSVLNQSYDNFELIIIDDCSNDGTSDILNNLSDSRINVFYNNVNMGSSKSRNVGLDNSTGEIIAYLDSDNLWCETYLEAIVGAFTILPDADAIYSAQWVYDNFGDLASIRFGSYNKSLLHNKNYIDLNSFCHKRYLINSIGGFDDSLTRLIDWDFILKISMHYKIYSIPILLSKYFTSENNRISSNSGGNINIRKSNKNYMKCILNNYDYYPSVSDSSNRKVLCIIYGYSSLNNIKNCINSLKLSKLDLKIWILKDLENKSLNLYFNSLSENIEIMNCSNFDDISDKLKNIDRCCDDILLLCGDYMVGEYAIENMLKISNSYKNAVIVPQNIKLAGNSEIIKHVPYASIDFSCDISPSLYYNNIINLPYFYDGEELELNYITNFCFYLNNEVIKKIMKNDGFEKYFYNNDFYNLFYNILGLRIIYCSNSFVFSLE